MLHPIARRLCGDFLFGGMCCFCHTRVTLLLQSICHSLLPSLFCLSLCLFSSLHTPSLLPLLTPPSSNRLPLSLFLPLFPVSLSVCRSLLGLPINLLYVNITLYFRGRKISRKVNLKYFLEKIFSRKYLPAKISSRENILSRKNLPAKISSRENIFRRFFLCRKYVGW